MIANALPPVPAARTNDLVVTEVKGEVLVYDLLRHHIHQLNPTTAAVWQACDGHQTLQHLHRSVSIALDAPVSLGTLHVALAQLQDAQLLVGPLDTTMRIEPQTRRTFLRRAAVAGAVAAPLLTSITAATAASTGSGVCPDGDPNPVAEGECKGQAVGKCCCDDASNLDDPGCGRCGRAPGDDADDDLVCLGAN